MQFKPFPAMNDQHLADYNAMANDLFTGDPNKIHKVVENPEE